MKPLKSYISAAILAAILIFAPALLSTGAMAQDSFSDVPSTHWAYAAITDFQQNGILIGYPDGFFSGKRVLTRYEFALAIKRAIEYAAPLSSDLPVNNANPDLVPVVRQVTSNEAQNFNRLVEAFGKDLLLLQANAYQLRLRLNAISSHVKPVIIRSNPVVDISHGPSTVNRPTDLHAVTPILNSGSVGGPALDFSSPTAVANPNGINFNLSSIGKVNVGGEVSRSTSQFESAGDPDNSAYNLNLRYNSGQLGILGGYKYIDPGYEDSGVWNMPGLFSSLTNVQGPYLRLNYALSPKTQFQIGSDLLAGARNRAYSFGGGVITGFGPHDFISTLSAGLQYKLWRSTSLTADWGGAYWDLSSASSGSGGESHPFESYINLGTGINLRGNAMLKMGYQIGSFGNLSGLGGLGPSGSGQSYNAFTTQLNVKF